MIISPGLVGGEFRNWSEIILLGEGAWWAVGGECQNGNKTILSGVVSCECQNWNAIILLGVGGW